jgi:beta-lactamase superfamily II metal-dependent hydrolase
MNGEPTLAHIDFWDVWQGDCSVIHLSDGSLIIIDVGPKRSPLISWLHGKSKMIRHVLLTHNDADHAGALSPLLADHGGRVQHLSMLLDRPKNDPKFEALFGHALAWGKRTGRSITQVTSGQTLWASQTQGLELKIVHPTFSESILADDPNKGCAMVVLESKQGWLKVWPGDLELGTVVKKCSGQTVHSMVGPHHGCPSDLLQKRNRASKYQAAIGAQELKLKSAFLSVGSGNTYKHPNPSYVYSLAKEGTHVVCSQVTKFCDAKRCTKGNRPVFNGTALLGLPTPHIGVACRGTKRVHFQGDQAQMDKYAMAHLIEASKLATPLCLKGRGWKQGDAVTLP